MAIETRSKQLGDSEYTVEGHGAIKGRSLLLRLTKIAGTSLAGINKGNVADAIARLAASISEEDLSFFCDEFAKKTMVGTEDGGAVQLSKVFDVHFAGNYLTMCQWLAFAIEVNFASFFVDAKTLLAKGGSAGSVVAEAMKSESL